MSITKDGISINNEQLYALPVGSILIWLTDDLPSTNYLLCDGKPYTPSEYPELYNIIKNSYGGSSTSPKLPNLLERSPIGGILDSNEPSNVIDVDIMPSVSNATNKTGGNSTLMPSQLIHTHLVTGKSNYLTAINNSNNTDYDSDNENAYNLPSTSIFNPPYRFVGDKVDESNLSTHLPPHKVVNYIIYAGHHVSDDTNATNYL